MNNTQSVNQALIDIIQSFPVDTSPERVLNAIAGRLGSGGALRDAVRFLVRDVQGRFLPKS